MKKKILSTVTLTSSRLRDIHNVNRFNSKIVNKNNNQIILWNEKTKRIILGQNRLKSILMKKTDYVECLSISLDKKKERALIEIIKDFNYKISEKLLLELLYNLDIDYFDTEKLDWEKI